MRNLFNWKSHNSSNAIFWLEKLGVMMLMYSYQLLIDNGKEIEFAKLVRYTIPTKCFRIYIFFEIYYRVKIGDLLIYQHYYYEKNIKLLILF